MTPRLQSTAGLFVGALLLAQPVHAQSSPAKPPPREPGAAMGEAAPPVPAPASDGAATVADEGDAQSGGSGSDGGEGEGDVGDVEGGSAEGGSAEENSDGEGVTAAGSPTPAVSFPAGPLVRNHPARAQGIPRLPPPSHDAKLRRFQIAGGYHHALVNRSALFTPRHRFGGKLEAAVLLDAENFGRKCQVEGWCYGLVGAWDFTSSRSEVEGHDGTLLGTRAISVHSLSTGPAIYWHLVSFDFRAAAFGSFNDYRQSYFEETARQVEYSGRVLCGTGELAMRANATPNGPDRDFGVRLTVGYSACANPSSVDGDERVTDRDIRVGYLSGVNLGLTLDQRF